MDYSMFAPKKKPEKEAAPPPPPPQEEEVAHPRGGGGPCMNGYISHLDQMSRIRRLKNIEFTHSRSLRMNFRGYRDDFDDYYYGHGPDHMYNELHYYPPRGYPDHGNGHGPHGPPPPPPTRRYPFRPPPPPPSQHGPGAEPPPCPFFSDENPNGCTVM